MDLIAPVLWLLTGPIGAGKTMFCRHLVQAARSQALDAAGLLSPAWIESGQKIGILAEDIRSGEQRTLARIHPPHPAGLVLGPWHFDQEVLQWGNQVIANSCPCDLLIVDELGPLEFNRQVGLIAAFDVISEGRYRAGCVVVRPSLLGEALSRWPWAKPADILEAAVHQFLPLR
jgi:nucleoside-triphosphatase THEP1